MLLTTQSGSQEQEDRLVHTRMTVQVTHTVEVTGVPTTDTPATATGPLPTQTVTTHREIRGVVVGVLIGLPSDPQPKESEEDDLY